MQFTAAVTSKSRFQARLFPGKPAGELCQRCRQLESEDIFAARDGVRDVGPRAFQDTLGPVLKLREAVCLQIVDANDFDATCISDLLDATTTELGIEHMRTILVVNKKDLSPRLDEHDLLYLRHRASHGSVHCTEAHAVSAITGEGVAELAAAVVDAADGRHNVIVCGAASVGKSTLINILARQVATLAARSLPERTRFEDGVAQMRDEGRLTTKISSVGLDGGRTDREGLMRELKLTVSHLPGTTIESLQVKCFASWAHSMYDTPGVVVPHSLAYSLFPVHVMAPLMQPARPRARVVHVQAGESLLLEASWIAPPATEGVEANGGRADTRQDALVLGRIDVSSSGEDGADGADVAVHAIQLSSPAVRARVVPTVEAPTIARVPPAHVAELREAFLHAGNTEDAEALHASTLERALQSSPQIIDAPYHPTSQRRSVEVTFANIGSVTFVQPEAAPFRLNVRAVEGSKAWHRPPLYEHTAGEEGAVELIEGTARSYDVAELARSLAETDAAVTEKVQSVEEAARAQRPPSLPTKPVHEVEEGSELAELQKAIDSGAFTDEQRKRFRELVFGEDA